MLHRFFPLILFAATLSAAPMTYTVTGIGSGSWNSQPFTDAIFTFTFTSDTEAIVHGTGCCGGADSTPAGTAATVTVGGFAPATLTGNQAIFLNRSEETVGIWHFNSPDYLTVAAPKFANDDLTTASAPATGTSFSYVTPLPLSTGGTLYFSAVRDVYYSQQAANSGEVTLTSVTPNSGLLYSDTPHTFTAVVSDNSGAGDIGGLDLQFRDKPNQPNACWLYYNATDNTLTINRQNVWGQATPIGASGATLAGDACTVDTTTATVSASGNDLTLNVPIEFTYADGRPWGIFLAAQNKANVSTDYSEMGTVTVESPGSYGFHLSVSPTSQKKFAGYDTEFGIAVQRFGGFDEPVTLSATYAPATGGNPTPLSISFFPETVEADESTMIVSSPFTATPDRYTFFIKASSPSRGETTIATLELSRFTPFITASPNSGGGSTQAFTFSWADSTPINALNILFASSFDGSHACWIYFDVDESAPHSGAHRLFLAGDDGVSWMDAGSAGYFPSESGAAAHGENSQCVIGGPGTQYDPDLPPSEGSRTLTIPITFKPGFAGTKTIYVRTANDAGYDSGYQTRGEWTVP
jgi:hypothetical protein